jgi:hypothetical protein
LRQLYIKIILEHESDFNDQTLKHNDMIKASQDEIINLKLVIEEIKNKCTKEFDREM